MTDTLECIQQAAREQVAQSTLLLNNRQTSIALQQLLLQCNASDPYQPYNKRPGLLTQLQQLPEQLNCSLPDLLQVMMLQLIADFSMQRVSLTLTNAISSNYLFSITRIYQFWSATPASKLTIVNDSLLKDIGLLTTALLPVTERVVEPFSALQRYLLFRHDFKQGYRYFLAWLSAKGNKPVCRLHIHLAEINGLTPNGWRTTCRQLAKLLLLNPKLKGIVGSSWFYDPAIASISPKLAFISELLSEMHASWFFSHIEDKNSGAFNRSATRQQAFKDGIYQPKNFVIFIPRDRLLAWHRRQSSC